MDISRSGPICFGAWSRASTSIPMSRPEFQRALRLMDKFNQDAGMPDIDASVGYYGVGIAQLPREAHAIPYPVLVHIPEDDHFVDSATQRRVHGGLDGNPKVTLYDYPGAGHGFATEFGKRRSPEAAELAARRNAMLSPNIFAATAEYRSSTRNGVCAAARPV